MTPPDGFVADEPVLSTDAVDTVTALQFTLTDIGSDWTETGITHVINTRVRPGSGRRPCRCSTSSRTRRAATTAKKDTRSVRVM